MATKTRAFALAAAAALLLSLTSTAEAARGVRWRDIRGWTAAGTRWAIALDADRQPIAVYDLAYPDLLARVKLGTIGSREATLKEAIRQLRRASEDPDLEATDDEREAARKAVSQLSKIGDRALQEGALPEEWWTQVPWKHSSRIVAASSGAPLVFRLSDIDLPGAGDALRKLEKIEEDPDEGPILGRGFLERFEFQRREDGGYDLFWSPPSVDARTSGMTKVTRPRKLVDLRSPHQTFYRVLALDAFDKSLGFLVGKIPIPIVGALIGTAMNRFINLREALIRFHEDALSEMITAAELEEGPFSPFNTLTHPEIARAARSILWGQSSITSALKWIFVKPEKSWRKSLAKEASTSEKSLRWLATHGEKITTYNSRFAMARSSTGRTAVYTLSRSRILKGRRPYVAIDYERPERFREDRVAIEAISTLIDFSSRFIPWVGSFVYQAYWAVVERPVEISKRWESQLSSHLEERRRVAGEDFEFELNILHQQKINAFEAPRETLEKLVQVRKDQLGIPRD